MLGPATFRFKNQRDTLFFLNSLVVKCWIGTVLIITIRLRYVLPLLLKFEHSDEADEQAGM
jgi:hypothetical protein